MTSSPSPMRAATSTAGDVMREVSASGCSGEEHERPLAA
jgi:hypothetical protein